MVDKTNKDKQKEVLSDTIPRIQQLVPHMRDQLMALRKSSTFEQSRLLYSQTVDRLVAQGLGRRTRGTVGDRDRYWSPTRDVLKEGMRLGFVEEQKLPSARRYLDKHRERVYRLTDTGFDAATEAKFDFPAFCDRLATAIYDIHPYFRSFIDRLVSGPIGCPEVSEGEVEQSRKNGEKTEHWLELAIQRTPPRNLTAQHEEQIRQTIIATVRKRFGGTTKRLPTSKQIAEALNDAYIEASLRTQELCFGAIDLKILRTWGTQLMLVDQSRYVPSHAGQNLIWLAADVFGNGRTKLVRKTLAAHESALADAVVMAYMDQAKTANSNLQAPYLPIFRVRAQAAFQSLVTRSLIDIVIERLATGSIPQPGVQIWLHLGTTRQPNSEPVYRRGGFRRYEITMQPRLQGDNYVN